MQLIQVPLAVMRVEALQEPLTLMEAMGQTRLINLWAVLEEVVEAPVLQQQVTAVMEAFPLVAAEGVALETQLTQELAVLAAMVMYVSSHSSKRYLCLNNSY